MKTSVTILIGMCMLALSAEARIGESNVEIAKRYGPVQHREEAGTNKWRGVYSFKNYRMICTFETNNCIMEVVIPLPLRQGKFTESEVISLRDSIAGAGTWKIEPGTGSQETRWINNSNRVVASWLQDASSGHKLVVAPASVLLKQANSTMKRDTESR